MNLGDGLLFELENGKPKLILLSHGVEKHPVKPSCRSRAANVLSSRQPSLVEEVQGEERPARQLAGRHRDSRSKAGGANASINSNTVPTGGKNTPGCSVKAVPKVKSDRHKHGTNAGPPRANGRTGQPQSAETRPGGKRGQKETPAPRDTGLKEGLVCLTNEQLQKILNSVQTSSLAPQPPQEHSTQEEQTGSKCSSSANEGGAETKEEEREEKQEKGGDGGQTDTPERSQDKDNRVSGCLFSWMEERESESRATMDAKKAQWRRELDEQVALKQQQRSAPSRLQAEEDTDSLVSVQTSISHREQPAAIRSSLRVGEVSPMQEMLSVERREEQRRRWLEELDRQREETTERRRREKQLQNQTEDHELWATHFDSLHRKLPDLRTSAPSAPPPAPSNSSERGEWEPSSSLSLVWEAMSSCGAESVGGASVDTTGGYSTKPSHLRTMTALLDPAQIEERERRRLKQLEQQRDIEAQMEERRRQRAQEEARRKEEEAEEERRVALERERLERQYELDTQRERLKSKQAEEPKKNQDEESPQQAHENREAPKPDECSEKNESNSLVSPYRDTAVQTEDAPSLTLQTPDASTQVQPPPSLPAASTNRSRGGRAGKENICVPAGGGGGAEGGGEGVDPYEAFARTERSRRDKRRPEWNTQRPSRRFVPASQRYPAPLQRHRQESRLRRQAELLALQERTCLSRTDPPPPPHLHLPLQNQDSRLLPNPAQTRTTPNRKAESFSRGLMNSAAASSDRGRSPPVPAVRYRIQSQLPSSIPPHPPHPPDLEFIPYVRTDEVFNLDPLESADTPPPRTHTASPLLPPPPDRDPLLRPELRHTTHTLRQQEILKGLAQLRQGLLQKQRELETDLNPLLKRHNGELRASSASHRM